MIKYPHLTLNALLFVAALFILTACGGAAGGGATTEEDTGGVTTGTQYTVSVDVTGLSGSGLQISLSAIGGIQSLDIPSNGIYTFSNALDSGAAYVVSVNNQPAGQICSISGNAGFINRNVTATITCANTQTIGGTVNGLVNGTSVGLRLNSRETLTVSVNGGFTFSTQLATGTNYAVTVANQPTDQICLVENSGGTVGNNAVSTITVNCAASTPGYHVGGSISGFSGLIILGLNGIEELARTYNGSFTFSSPLPTNTPYTVTVLQPPVGYACTVANGTGVIAESDFPFVDVQCARDYTNVSVGVDPDGANLASGETMTVTLNGVEDKILDRWDFSTVFFTTRLNTGEAYSVDIKTPPPGRVCTLANSKGVITAGETPVVTIQCAADTVSLHTIGGSISNLTGTGLVLNLGGSESLPVAANDTGYTFTSSLPSGTSYTVSIESQPVGQICALTREWIWVSGDVLDANVICSIGPHQIGGYVTGMKNTGLELQLNGAERLPINGDGSFAFSTLFSDGMNYTVTVSNHPVDQVCTVTRHEGWNITASVNDILVDCVDSPFTVKLNVAGYSSTTPLELQLNSGEVLWVDHNTTGYYGAPFEFNNKLDNGQAYTVTIIAQPAGQYCSLTNPSGVVTGADVTNVAAYCETLPAEGPYEVGVTVSGLLGSGLSLQLNGGEELSFTGNGYKTFTTTLADGAAYAVTLFKLTADPLQLCEVRNGNGTIASAHVTNVSVVCRNAVQPRYPTNGSRWLDYVKNDGTTPIEASDTACDPTVTTDLRGYQACLNGGEFMMVDAAYLSACDGVTATDHLNAFDWVCHPSPDGVKVVSTGLKQGVYLSDLIDFTEGRFKPNFVTIDSGVVHSTQPAIWWNNPVRINNIGDDDSGYNQIKSHDITLVTGNVPSVYTLKNNTALLVEPGFAISGYTGQNIVKASERNFLWFEGHIDGATGTGSGILWITANFSVMNNVQVLNTGSSGVFMSGNNNKLRHIVANANASVGITLRGRNYDIIGLTANNNLGLAGIDLDVYENWLVSSVTANGNTSGNGVYVRSPDRLSMSDVSANNNGTPDYYDHHGIRISGQGTGNRFSNLSANNNAAYGVYAEEMDNSSFSGISAHGNSRTGVYLGSGFGVGNTSVSQVNTSGNGGAGLYVFRWDQTRLDQITAANNALDGISLSQVDRVTLSNVSSNNNGGHGIAFDATANSTSVNLTTVNNGGSGISNYEARTNIMIGASAINNTTNGFEITRSDDINNSSLLALNNGGDGLKTYTSVNSVAVSNLVSANNAGFGLNLDSDHDYYTGLLHVGTNGTGMAEIDSGSADCQVATGFTELTGLLQGGNNNGNNVTYSCILNPDSTSDATIVDGINATTSVVGKLTVDDTTNPDDNQGTVLFENISDWSLFEHAYRTWGKEGLAFADSGHQGACNTIGETCRIWDWSAATTDIGNGGTTPAVYNVLAVPTGDEVLSHNWSGLNDSQAYCDTNFPGSVWGSANSCTSTYLRHAVEIAGDGIGNDNYLCESGETCLHTPNIGSYQGHGVLQEVGLIANGTLTGITLMQYESVGR